MTGFWERRKAAVRAEEAAEERARTAADQAEEQARLDQGSDEEILRELDLPDPDSMAEGDDFSAFLKKAVPERIRRRALRRLWTTDPVLANLDGLVEYGEDFTDAATVVENLQTAYRVGEGMVRHVMETDEQAQAAADDDEDAMVESDPEDPASMETDEKSDNLTRKQISPKKEENDKNHRFFSEKTKCVISKPRRMSYSYDSEPR